MSNAVSFDGNVEPYAARRIMEIACSRASEGSRYAMSVAGMKS